MKFACEEKEAQSATSNGVDIWVGRVALQRRGELKVVPLPLAVLGAYALRV
ncbi:hypothetical protein DNHGIG_33360 [Collibacillus ludicampi]|uniref:Uncharacterized protein n=1 Tax=Collibacillus ludicampi TaxID=2771369 RepID=A0AAV4LK87_9BACL|nr:hypothetical protein [Collibacillus ludicampi]GIM47787.1 hypothetical protein DNHGIG_33360 [Collibacillus ludicampi]